MPRIKHNKQIRYLLKILFCLGVCLLSACVTKRAPIPNDALKKIAAEWQNQHNDESPRVFWLDDFQDPDLNKLIIEAMNNNFNVKTFKSRIKIAHSKAIIGGADLKPHLGFDAGVKSSWKKDANDKWIRTTNNDMGFSATWELDLWKKLSNEKRAAYANYEAAKADFEAVRLSIAGRISASWFNLISAEQQLKLAQLILESTEKTQKVIEKRFDQGLTTALDVRLGRSLVEDSKSKVEDRKLRRIKVRMILELLLGRYPSANVSADMTLPKLKYTQVPAGLPSDLLLRRPDIIAAEYRLIRARERYKMENKNLLPSFRLTASLGSESNELRRLLNPEVLVTDIALRMIQPILDGGELKARQEQFYAELEEEVSDFAEVMLIAFQEVELSLASETLLKTREAATNASWEESKTAAQIAQRQYNRGLIDITTLQLAQRRVFDQGIRLLDTKRDRLINRVELYVALGGAFKTDAEKEQ